MKPEGPLPCSQEQVVIMQIKCTRYEQVNYDNYVSDVAVEKLFPGGQTYSKVRLGNGVVIAGSLRRTEQSKERNATDY